MRLLAPISAILVLVLAGAAGSSPIAGTILTVPGTVKALAADGHLAAVAVVPAKGRCDRILFWKGSGTASSTSAGCNDQEVDSLALAGHRALWVNYDFGNHAYCRLLTATTTRLRPTEIPICQPDEADTYVGGLAGDGALLVLNDWFDFLAQGNIQDVELRRVDGTSTNTIRVGPTARTVTSVSSGLIAIRGGGGAISVVRSEGSLVHRFAVKAQTAKLDGARTVVIRTGSTLTPWDLSSAVDGNPRRMKGGRFEDVQSGIAVYVLHRAVHLLRLSDGRDVVIRRAGRGNVFAQLEAPGLFFAAGNRVEFIPMGTVRNALG